MFVPLRLVDLDHNLGILHGNAQHGGVFEVPPALEEGKHVGLYVMLVAGDDVWIQAHDFGEVGLERLRLVGIVYGVMFGGEDLLDLEMSVGFGVVQQPDHPNCQFQKSAQLIVQQRPNDKQCIPIFCKPQLAYQSNCFFGIIQITFHRNRMSCCKQCNQKQLRYKVLQSDLQFQIKKMSEDLASEKVTLQLQYQKQSKKSIEKYNKERLEREEENRRWLQKYDQIVQEYERRISAMQRDYGLREKEIEQSETSKYTKKEQQIRNNYSASLNKLENSYQNTIQQLQDKFQQECLRAKLQKEEEISRLNKKHEEHTSGVVADYDVRIRQLKQEIKTGLDNIDRLKIQSHQKQTLLYEELYQRKQEISDLKYNVDQLKTNITILQEEIRHKNLEIEVIKEQHEQKLAQLEQFFQSQKESIVSSFSQQIENLLKDKLQDCQKFEQVVKDIQIKRENQIKIYETNLKEVKEFVEERPSREQDLEKINNLKELLLQKEKEFQKAFNEAKGYRLELNNKEEIFTKIFCNHSPLNIEKIGKKKEYKFPRTSSSTLKDMSKYHSVNTFHTLPAASDLTKKEKLVLQPKSTKFF